MPHSITYLGRMILLLLAQLCLTEFFTWVQTRAISELRARLVSFNMFLSCISFTECSKAVQLLSIDLMSWMFVFLMLSSDINVKTWPLPRTMGSMCAGWERAIKAL